MRKSYYAIGLKIIPFALVAFMAVSCQKERREDCTPNIASIAGTYKVTAMKYKATPTSTEQDYLLLRDDCEKDDYVVMKADGTYQYKDAGTTCSPDGSNDGTWSVSGNTVISDGVVAGTIQDFNCQSLTVYETDFFIPGDRITLTITRQ